MVRAKLQSPMKSMQAKAPLDSSILSKHFSSSILHGHSHNIIFVNICKELYHILERYRKKIPKQVRNDTDDEV